MMPSLTRSKRRIMTHDGRTTFNRMLLVTLIFVWSGSFTAQGNVTPLVPHQQTKNTQHEPAIIWKQKLGWRGTNTNHHDTNHHLRRTTRRMQHDKDLDEVDFEDPNAISYSPSVSLTPSVTPSERPTSTPSAVPTRAPSASPSQSPSATPSLSLSPTRPLL